MNNQSQSLVRECELRELVQALDAAAEILDGCNFRDANDNVLGLALRDCHAVTHTLKRAADFLAELQP
jgi:hypothetical protein